MFVIGHAAFFVVAAPVFISLYTKGTDQDSRFGRYVSIEAV
jgi:hypothetical protein